MDAFTWVVMFSHFKSRVIRFSVITLVNSNDTLRNIFPKDLKLENVRLKVKNIYFCLLSFSPVDFNLLSDWTLILSRARSSKNDACSESKERQLTRKTFSICFWACMTKKLVKDLMMKNCGLRFSRSCLLVLKQRVHRCHGRCTSWPNAQKFSKRYGKKLRYFLQLL